MMNLIYIWYHDIYWSKVFICTISTHVHDLGVKVTDVEVLKMLKVLFKFLRPLFPNFITNLIHLWFVENFAQCNLPPQKHLGQNQGHGLFQNQNVQYQTSYPVMATGLVNTSLFPNRITDLIHLWYEDTYWSKILLSSILPPPPPLPPT